MSELALLKVGKKAPNFTLPDQDNQLRSPRDFIGSWLLIYFYPKDLTPGCTVEACTFRDAWAELQQQGIKVVGISADAVATHQRFSKLKKLPFPLLSDLEKKVIRAYGVWGAKKFMGRIYQGIHRVSYLISPSGTIAKVYNLVKPNLHAREVLSDVHKLAALYA